MTTAIVRGLAMGSLYGLLAMAIALLRRTTGALSFAHGEIGGFAALFAIAAVGRGTPWGLAAAGGIAVAALTGAGFHLLVGRRIPGHEPVMPTVATVGLLLALIAGGQRLWGVYPRVLPTSFSSSIEAFGALVAPSQLVALVTGLAGAVGFTMLLRRTGVGLATLAAAHDRDEAALLGVPVTAIATVVWGSTAALAAIAALLFGPVIGAVAPGTMTLFFVRSVVAVTIGGTATMWGPLLGGLAVGVVEQLAVQRFVTSGVPGVDVVAVLGLLVVAIVVRPGLEKT